MANIKISGLTALTSPNAADLVPVVDTTPPSSTKRTTVGELVIAGAKELARGTEAAPAVAFGGATDANTGIYSPGADQLALSTNGTGRLFVDASGRIIVGAATAAVGVPLEIVSNAPGLAVGVRGRSADNIGIIGFYPNNSSTEYARIQSNGDSSLSIGTGSSTERLRITSAGQLSFIGAGSSGSPAVGFNGSAPSNSLVVDSAGLVGIGTSAPSYALDIRGSGVTAAQILSSGSDAVLFLKNTTASTGREYYLSSQNNGRLGLVDATAGAARVTLDSSGRVGIGTTDPQVNLHLKDATNPRLRFGQDNTSVQQQIESSNAVLVFTSDVTNVANGGFVFKDGVDERARIDGSGRLLVGTSSSDGNYYGTTGHDHLIQTSVFGSSVGFSKYLAQSWVTHPGTNTNHGVHLAFARSRGTSNGSYTPVASSDKLAVLSFQGADGSQFVEAARIEAQVDGTPGANDMPGRLVFSTTADGASSPTERMRISSSGDIGWGSSPSDNYLRNNGLIASLATYNSTTATGANVSVDTDGVFYRSTSSIKYKTNVENVEDSYSDALLGCRPVWYQSTCEADNPDWGYWGFIAEEVAQIDPRLCFFKQTEEGTLEPEGVQYDRFVPHLLNLIKRQQQAIETLEAKVTALETP